MKISGLSQVETDKLVPPHTILLGYAGSTAYGLARDSSDIDIKGTCIAPIECYLGLDNFEQLSHSMEVGGRVYDSVVYELRKFIRLLTGANPNVMEMLWLPNNLYIGRTPAGNVLIENREMFLTKKAYHSFTGYAHAQLYKIDHTTPTGDMGLKRKALVETYGFDTKNASHLFRLMNMCIELLTDGGLVVDRSNKDRQFLLDIKDGKYQLEWLKREAEDLFKLAKEAYVRSDLPKDVDHKAVNSLLLNIFGQHAKDNRWLTSS